MAFGAAVTYTVTVHNNGPDPVTGAPVTDNFPANLTVNTWTCTATGGSCTVGGLANSRNGTVTLNNGGTATFTATTTAVPAATASKPLPSLTTLDAFNTNGANLGSNWTQPNNAIRVDATQAQCGGTIAGAIQCGLGTGVGVWAGTTGSGPVYGGHQGAAFTFASTPSTNSELLMAVTGTPSGGLYPSGVRVQYASGSATIVNTASVAIPAGMIELNPANNTQMDTLTFSGSRVLVSTTANTGGSWTDLGSVAIPTGSFANGNTLEAVIQTDGTVDVWKVNGGTTYLGSVAGLTSAYTSGGRVGMSLASGQRVDNFKGGTL